MKPDMGGRKEEVADTKSRMKPGEQKTQGMDMYNDVQHAIFFANVSANLLNSPSDNALPVGTSSCIPPLPTSSAARLPAYMRRARALLGRPSSRGDRAAVQPLSVSRAHALLDAALDALAKGRSSPAEESAALAALRRALLGRTAVPAAEPPPPPSAKPLR